jgi:ATP-dependent Clp protease protease subunit
VFEQLLRERIIVIGGPITDDAATEIIAQLLFLDRRRHGNHRAAPVSRQREPRRANPARNQLAGRRGLGEPGDLRHDGRCRLARAHALSRASRGHLLLLAHGVRGQRTANARARFMFTPVSFGRGPHDVKDIERTAQVMCEIMAADTQQTIDTIRADMRGGRTFDVNDARTYGLIDRVEAFDISAL